MSGNFSLLDFKKKTQNNRMCGKVNVIVIRLFKQIDNYIDLSVQFLHPVSSPVSQTRKQRFFYSKVLSKCNGENDIIFFFFFKFLCCLVGEYFQGKTGFQLVFKNTTEDVRTHFLPRYWYSAIKNIV